MKILVVGSGGREHAICRALLHSDVSPQLFIAPGNPGTANLGTNVAIKATDKKALCKFAKQEGIDYVVVGPEQPLVEGLIDALEAQGTPCVGPSQAAAKLEGSKAFTRELCRSENIPSPHFEVITKKSSLQESLDAWKTRSPVPPVLKADALASGKGVYLPDTREECEQIAENLLNGRLLDGAGKTFLIEERMVGTEASLFFACDGSIALALPHARDHKRIYDHDKGPNTGGMGAISPNPELSDSIVSEVEEKIVKPTLHAMARNGKPFKGFLFVGIMLTSKGIQLLEFNVRLGDPETQAILPRLHRGDFLKICRGIADQMLDQECIAFDPHPTCALVLAAGGYPENTQSGETITLLPGLESPTRWLIHAGTAMKADHSLVTAGGRVAAIVSQRESAEAARKEAYAGLEFIQFKNSQVRKDIGNPKKGEE